MSIREWLRRWLGIDRDLAKLREDFPRAVEATVLRIKPGDVLLLRLPEKINHDQIRRIEIYWTEAAARLGIQPPIAVLDGGASFQILRRHARGARRAQRFASGGVVASGRSYLVGEDTLEQVAREGGQ
jgi:hypothetical protein